MLTLILSAAAATEPPRYDVLNLRQLGFWDADALNNHGHVVGAAPEGVRLLWDGETVTQLPLPTDSPVITGLNDSGALIGYRWFPLDGDRGFLMADGAFAESKAHASRPPSTIPAMSPSTVSATTPAP